MWHVLHEVFFWIGLLGCSICTILLALGQWWLMRETKRQRADRVCVHCGGWTKGHQVHCARCHRAYATGYTNPAVLGDPTNVVHVLCGGIWGAALECTPEDQVLALRTASGVDVRLRVRQITMTAHQ